MQRKILIMGLPGAGKTTLARKLAPLLHAVLFNADEVRKTSIAIWAFRPPAASNRPAAWAGSATASPRRAM